MATLDSLPGDQRAVLQLVLRRGRGYAEIARQLSISEASVRERALAALDALGPPTELGAGERRLICDYLLGQSGEAGPAEARALLEGSAPARTWARSVAGELGPVTDTPLPEIPGASEPDGGPPSSRRGGMVVIGLAAIVIVAAVVVIVVALTHHHSSHSTLADRSPSTSRTQSSSSSSSTTSSSTTASAKPIAQINLHAASAGSKAIAAAEILEQDSEREIAIVGEHIPANTKHDSYEVWLYNSPTSFEKLGFVSPAVGKSGRFSDATALPANAGRYKELIVTTETAQKPMAPGPIFLRGTITGLS